MDPRYYNRPLSPGGRRLVVPERASTGTFNSLDPYYSSSRGHTSYASPRTSGERVSHSTYIPHAASSSSSRSGATYDSYTGRPRRSTLTESDSRKPSISTTNLTPSIPIRTSRPVIHSLDRPSSPLARSFDDRSGGGYVTPAISAPRHKKTYSVDNAGHSHLINERDVDARRRESLERGGYHPSGTGGNRNGGYHSNRPQRPQLVTDDSFSYTDAAGMYRDTEPSWRRERRGSIDRNARPTSMFGMESGYGADPRKSRDLGPPPSTRGFDKLNDKLNGGGVGRTGSHRERNRSSSRERSSAYFSDAEYGVPPRSATARPTVHQDRDYRDPYYEDRTGRPHTARYEDQDVASRGFGIRSGSIDRHGTRGSDESLDRAPLYPPGPIAPQPDMRDYVPAPPPSAHPSLRDERRDRDRRDRDYVDRDSDRDRDRDRRRDDRDHKMSGALPVAAAAAAAAGAAAYGNRDGDREREREPRERRYEDYPDNRGYPKKAPNEVAEPPRERRYETEKDRRDEREKDARKEPAAPLDPEEDYRRRVQQEMERSAQREVRDRDSDSDRERRRRDRDRERERERDRARDGPRERSSREEVPNLPPRPADRRDDRRESVFGGALVQEPGEMPDSDGSSGDKKVKIVDPPRESPPPPKGILKQPTQKFPEDPNPIREGVAPLKDAKKGKDIPTDARWTKIDRRLVNPEALEEAKERFEERMDCVIVLRVLKKEEIQKLADRTKEIREARDYDRDRRDRRRDRERDREHDRDYRDKDRDRDDRRRHRRDYDTSGDSYSDDDDYRERRPRAIEPPPPTTGAVPIAGGVEANAGGSYPAH